MKINDIEKLLGASKANIRFYEKEGLLTPGRAENGCRDYSEQDIARLREIIILRKLDVPVHQIQEIFDGCLPLQEAMDSNIQSLQAQIRRLEGALALSRQIRDENLPILRYWDILQQKEQQGQVFQNIYSDDRTFMTPYFYRVFGLDQKTAGSRTGSEIGVHILGMCLLVGLVLTVMNGKSLPENMLRLPIACCVGAVILLPRYFIGKKNPALADKLVRILPWIVLGVFLLMVATIVILIKTHVFHL